MTTKKIIIISSISALVLGVVIYFVTRKKDDGTDGSGTDTSTNPKDNKGNDNFPLKIGSKGERVRQLNTVLNIPPTDTFTVLTQRTLKERFNVTEVSQSVWDKFKPFLANQI